MIALYISTNRSVLWYKGIECVSLLFLQEIAKIGCFSICLVAARPGLVTIWSEYGWMGGSSPTFSFPSKFYKKQSCCLRQMVAIWWHDNRFEVNWRPKPTLVLRWISKFFLFGALPIDTLKIKHSEKLKEISSRHVLENLPEKSKHNGMEIAKLPDYCLGSHFTKDTSQKT